MKAPFICLHCNTEKESDAEEDREARLVQCECGEAAWRLKCNCTGLILDGQCMECGTPRS